MAVNRILTNTLQACFSRQRSSLHFAQSLEHGGRVRILRIEREGFLVVLDGLGLVSRGHVGFAEAIVRVCRIRVQLDVQLKNAYRVGSLLVRQQAVAQGIDGADRKSTRLNSSHGYISYAAFCLQKKKTAD